MCLIDCEKGRLRIECAGPFIEEDNPLCDDELIAEDVYLLNALELGVKSSDHES